MWGFESIEVVGVVGIFYGYVVVFMMCEWVLLILVGFMEGVFIELCFLGGCFYRLFIYDFIDVMLWEFGVYVESVWVECVE